MQLLVSDANIFIDLVEGELLEEFFALPYEVMTPDILYSEELADEHADLLDLGLKLESLGSDDMNEVISLIAKYRDPSRMDLMALVLAKRAGCPLLSGDRALVLAAQQEGVLVNGSIWVIEQLISHDLLVREQALEALDKMQASGRRLPWGIAKQRLMLLEK